MTNSVPVASWDLYIFLLTYTKNQPSASKYAIHGSYGVRSPCVSTVFCFWHRSAVDLQCYWCSNESPAKWCNLGQALQNEATHPPLRGVFEAPYISVLGKKSLGLFSLTWAAPEFSLVFKPGSQWYEHQRLEALGSSLKSSGECILGALGGQVPWKDKNIRHTVDGSKKPVNSPVEVGSLSHSLQSFLHPRWLAGCLNHQPYVPKHPKTESKVVIWSWCTPTKIDMEPEINDFQALNLLSRNPFLGSMLSFGGCREMILSMVVLHPNIQHEPHTF